MSANYSETFSLGPRKFSVAYVFGLGWVLYDETAMEQMRSAAPNGLFGTKQAAKQAAQDKVDTLYNRRPT